MRHRRRIERARLVEREDGAALGQIRDCSAGHSVQSPLELQGCDEHLARLGKKALRVLGALPLGEDCGEH